MSTLKRGIIAGSYTRTDLEGNEVDTISVLDDSKVHLEDLTRLTEDDTVVFATLPVSGEPLGPDKAMIKNEKEEVAEIAAKLSNGADKGGYPITDLSFHGNLKFSGDNSEFSEGKSTASGANVEFAGDKSMFQVPLEMKDNSKVKISKSVKHKQDISIKKGSQLIVEKRLALSGEIHAYGNYD